MAKKEEKGFNISENYLSLGLGILVVVVVGALIFNYFGSRSAQNGGTTLTAEEQAAEEKKEEVSLPAKHKVTQGEDLWKISERYYKTGYNWTDIARENNLANPNVLLADTELIIPDVEPKVLPTTGEVTKVEDKAPITAEAITGDSYTVVSGDYLWKIALRAYGDGYKWVGIAKANELVNPNVIHAGNVLKIPR